MKRLLTITVASYALLGNVAFAADTPSNEETNMTPAPASDLALSCRNAQGKQTGHSIASRNDCATDRCIVEFEDQAENEGVALLLKEQEVPHVAAIVAQEPVTAQNLGIARNDGPGHEGRHLIARITSSVIFRE